MSLKLSQILLDLDLFDAFATVFFPFPLLVISLFHPPHLGAISCIGPSGLIYGKVFPTLSLVAHDTVRSDANFEV